jgi:hypothetical protein
MALLSGKKGATLQAALLFYIVANPMTYRLVDSLLGGVVGRIASPSGSPTQLGLIVHSIVFGLITYQLMKQ